MKPPIEDLCYRSAYSRCCQLQRHWYGIASLPALNYDAVFLYLCAIDAGLVPESVIIPQTCCRLQTDSDLRQAPDLAIGGFCGAVSIIFADTKLQDDVRDRTSTFARIGRWFLRKPVKKALVFLSRLNPHIESLLAGWTAAQIDVEASVAILTIERFIEPTAEALGTVASLFPGAEREAGLRGLLQNIGRMLGTAIVAADCALDWEDDLKTGECNPVRDATDASQVARLAVESVQNIALMCEAAFGPSSRSANVSRLVHASLVRTFQQRGQLPGDVTVIPVEQPDEQRPSGLVDQCASQAARIGARIQCGKQSPPRKIACPLACVCGCQILGTLPLLLGCTRKH